MAKGDASASLAEWPKLQALLAASSLRLPEISLRCTPDQWRAAIRRKGKATGICGWSPADLKLLPNAALEVLSEIFRSAVVHGVPEHLLHGWVCVLAKALCPSHIEQSRPITIYCTLYRVWASIVARDILQSWSDTFPQQYWDRCPTRRVGT